MTDINQEIQEAIKRNLPAQIGETLAKELQALADARKKVVSLQSEVDTIRDANETLIKENKALAAQLRGHGDLAEREAKVRERELKQDLRDLEVKLTEQRRKDAVDLVSLVFRSPVYRHHVEGYVPVPVEGSPGGNGTYPSPGTVLQGQVNTTTTVSQA